MPSPLFRAFNAFTAAAKKLEQQAGSAVKALTALGAGRRNESQRRGIQATLQRLAAQHQQDALEFLAQVAPHLISPVGIAKSEQSLNPLDLIGRRGGRRVAEPVDPGPKPWFVKPAAERDVVQVGRLRVKPDDPLVTGEMVEVTSSNVHSIGFDWDPQNATHGTLKVRFLQKRADGSNGPGPLYEYFNVAPEVFKAFRVADSKGRFVWDRLRIRGTVSGHRFRYRLKEIANGYMPRQAVRFGQNEYFIKRRQAYTSKTTGERRTFESQLEDRRVGAYRPVNRGRPPLTGRP